MAAGHEATHGGRGGQALGGPECDLRFGDTELGRVVSLLDALQCGALLVDRAGRIAYINSRLCAMMHRDRADLLGKSLFEIYPDEQGRRVVQYAIEHFAEPREQEFFLPVGDEQRVPVFVSGRQLVGDPPLPNYRIVTVIDISQQKRAEHEAQQQYSTVASLTDTVLEQAIELRRYTRELEQRVSQRTQELHTANMEAIYMLAIASEAKDLDTGAHVRRIATLSRTLAQELGLAHDEVDRIAYSSILHDVGKLHVPDHILRKPGPLTDDEWATIKQHTIVGERMLSREPFFDTARLIARSHHENWDGSGYPDGHAADAIPLPARIVRVADVFDALTTARPYKSAWTPAQARAEIEEQRGRLFDPEVVEVFLRRI